MKNGRLLVLLLVIFLLLIFVTSIVAIVVMLNDGGGADTEEGTALVLTLGGAMPEQPGPDQPIAGLGNKSQSIFEVDTGLVRAAADDDITQLFVQINGLAIGYGKVEELRDIIERFSTESGKPVTCWMEAAGNKEYLLALACDRIFMAPEGFFLVNGLHLGVTFYKGTLDKLGVEAEFTRAGKYKSAIEPMTSTEMSTPYREMMEALADSLYGHLVDAISLRREIDRDAVVAMIDDPPLTARAAYEAGLIDGLLYDDQMRAYLSGKPIPADLLPDHSFGPSGDDDDSAAGVASADDDDSAGRAPTPPSAANDDDSAAGVARADDDDSASSAALRDERIPSRSRDEEDVPRIGLGSYLDGRSRLGKGKGGKVAVVFCEGQITSGKSRTGSSMGSDTIARAIRKARRNDDVHAIVLRVDSPGGSGLASDVIWREVELARKEDRKPVVVSMSDLAASGGYYIAMGADAIVAQPTTLTGSIGVFAGKYNVAGLYEKLGLTSASIKRGEYSDLFVLNKSLGEDGTAKLEEFVDSFYGTFLAKAAMGRHTSEGAIHSVAQGRVWTGGQALGDDVALVDALGSLRTAVGMAKDRAGLDGETRLLLYPRQPSFWEELLEGGAGPLGMLSAAADVAVLREGGVSLLGQDLLGARAFVEAAPLLGSGQPVLLAPYTIEVR
ncbi:MAG: signal peptide peptidase SppA [Deltaproteobacteria bacterium]|nr:signal peptide peptidase SppA [Deltaproteobacteria bacterium]